MDTSQINLVLPLLPTQPPTEAMLALVQQHSSCQQTLTENASLTKGGHPYDTKG